MKLHAKYLALLDHASRAGHANVDDLRLCFELLSLAATIDQDCAARLAPHGLSEGKFVMLFLLGDAPDGLSPSQLAESGGVTRATITGLIVGLKRDGLVTSYGAKDDGRRINVRLTAKGRKIATELAKQHTDWIASLFSRVTPEKRRALRRSLRGDGGVRLPRVMTLLLTRVTISRAGKVV
jgi:DNA-binding MarR family transcriptional regulator